MQKLIGAALRPLVRRRARGRTVDDMIRRLEASGKTVQGQFDRGADTPANREAISHMVGIERWGQSRLRVALGAPFQRDSYRGYRPPEGASMADLRAAFGETRAATIALAREVAQAGVDPARTVPHNDLGDLSMVEWLAYLDGHAARERFRVRP